MQHFLDGNPNPTGACTSQVDQWYAYFRGCPEVCSNCPCAPLCVGENEDMIRVRIACFRLATAPFREGTDGVAIGEIEPADVCFLSHITPIQIDSPYNLELCTGQLVYLAGWGRTQRTNVPCDQRIEPENEAKEPPCGHLRHNEHHMRERREEGRVTLCRR